MLKIDYFLQYLRLVCLYLVLPRIILLNAIPVHNGQILTSRELIRISEDTNSQVDDIVPKEQEPQNLNFNCPNTNNKQDNKDATRLIAKYTMDKPWPPINTYDYNVNSYDKIHLKPTETRTMHKSEIIERWPNAIVPFEIAPGFNGLDLMMFEHALDEFHQHTCIRFIPHTNEVNYIVIKHDMTGCWSSIGRQGGRQEINLQSPECFMQPGMVLQQLMHVLGYFPHEHKHLNSNGGSYVTLHYQDLANKQPLGAPEYIGSPTKSGMAYNGKMPYNGYNEILQYSHPKYQSSVYSVRRPPPVPFIGIVSINFNKLLEIVLLFILLFPLAAH